MDFGKTKLGRSVFKWVCKSLFCLVVGIYAPILSCAPPKVTEPVSASDVAAVIGQVTDIMVHDVTNPPLAARFYAYICLAGIEALKSEHEAFSSLTQNIKGYADFSDGPAANAKVDKNISSVFAMYFTAMKMQPSGFEHEKNIWDFAQKCVEKGYSQEVVAESQAFGESVSTRVLAFSGVDGYKQTTSLARYSPLKEEGSWYPTPPGYFPPVEPHFRTLRPFFLDTVTQFVPVSPVAFSSEKDSEFFRLLEEVYLQVLTEENKIIASFWDCNPFALEDKGHLMVGLKKISPGAHWMGIANIACKNENVKFEKAMEVNAVLAMTLHDAFMACWDEKYRSNRVRPETAIRKYLDPNYISLLQTPPFPEYLSGHSVVSTASAVILTHYFGENFAYRDTVEVKYGLAARDFESFNQAAEEAAVSRLYGGIHYRDGIVEGQIQGRKVGEWTIQKLFDPMLKNQLDQ